MQTEMQQEQIFLAKREGSATTPMTVKDVQLLLEEKKITAVEIKLA